MRKLQIVAEGDVSHAKASLRSLSVEKAKQLADEKRQAAESAALARETARKQIAEAKASGTAQRDELKKLAAAEREAARVAKQAAKEAADAKRVSADRTRQATRMQETENRRLNENAQQQLIADIRDKAAQRRKMMPDATADGDGRSSGGRTRTRMQQAKEFLGERAGGRFLGAAGVAAELLVIQQAISAFIQEVRKAKEVILGEKVEAGGAQNKLAERMSEMRMKTGDMQKVLNATSGLGGVKSTAELSQAAMDQLDAGVRDPDQIIKRLAKFSKGAPELTDAQRSANMVARAKRNAEIARLSSGTSDAILDQMAGLALDTRNANGGGTTIGNFMGWTAEKLGAGKEARLAVENYANDQVFFHRSNSVRERNIVTVQLSDVDRRAVSGPKRASME